MKREREEVVVGRRRKRWLNCLKEDRIFRGNMSTDDAKMKR